MHKVRLLISFLFILLLFHQTIHSQVRVQSDLVDDDMMNLIRKEKFDHVLPVAMRNNKIDMWIHVMRQGDPDPLADDLGTSLGVLVFTDRGGDRIERAVLGFCAEELPESGAYDIFIAEEELIEGDAGWESIIGNFVAERNPQRIGVNFSERYAVADGISHTDYLKLAKALGDRYTMRVVSADNLIIEYLSSRVMSEIVIYGQLCKISEKKIEREFDKIVPSETALKNIEGNIWVRHMDGHEDNNNDYVIQRGDMIGLICGANAGSYSTHISGLAYVLRDGETGPPPNVKKIFDHALIARDIFRKNIKVGRTAGETLEILIQKLEEAGYAYINEDRFDINLDPEKTQVHIDFHALGKDVLQTEAPRISPLGPDWIRELKIPLYHTFTLEYMVHMPVPEKGKGKYLYALMHDGVMVTERGVEFPYPPVERIRIIR
ncbi:MAG: M24 family metallopeptidase [Candidatus Aminicenantes bacterium]|nr:MAG: M24 family metallopeptidase [Candidatus Aminicenantes bacterium]